jgi:hypothetical protein
VPGPGTYAVPSAIRRQQKKREHQNFGTSSQRFVAVGSALVSHPIA